MRRPFVLVFGFVPALALAAACARSSPAETTAAAPAAAASTDTATGSARLVVAVVLDQLGTRVLERYWDALPADGALRELAAEGARHRRVVFSYAGTYTAPGHASVFTGLPPRDHGIVSNLVYDRDREKVVPIVDDGEHAVLGHDGAHASPAALRAETVADRLHRATEGRGKVVSISVKDRGAILPAGRRPDLVLWYDRTQGAYTTSTYYAPSRPEWLRTWSAAHPVAELLTPWEPTVPRDVLSRFAGADDAPGEGDWLGFGVVFPHDPAKASRPLGAIRATPQSAEHQLALAREAVKQLDLGADEVPDLLCVSISSTDYVGHVFGPHSWEYMDNLVRVDRALGAFLRELERHTSVATLLTSDHGAAPLPEEATGHPAGRLDPDALADGLEAELDAELGDGDWVATFAQPFVYLSARARSEERRSRVLPVALRWLESRPEVAAAFDARELATTNGDQPSMLRRTAARSTPPDTAGDLFVVPAEHFVVDETMPEGKGTSHGTPWSYDREVPVLVRGPGVAHLETDEPLPMRRTAATLAALLGLAGGGPAEPLPGVGSTAR